MKIILEITSNELKELIKKEPQVNEASKTKSIVFNDCTITNVTV